MSEETKQLDFLNRVQVALDIDFSQEISDEEVYAEIEATIQRVSQDQYVPQKEKIRVRETVFNTLRRLDVLQPLVDDPTITEIMVNGPNVIFIEQAGKIVKTDVVFESKRKLEDVIQKIVGLVNRKVDESSPIVDARLENGSRVNVVLPPIALNGPIMTIRKFPDTPMTMEQLLKWKSISKEAAKALSEMVKAKYNIFICGGTGSGKTTFLNAMSNFIPSDERIITIEDSAELRIQGVQNLVSLETRNAGVDNRGEISMKDLIKSSLRMRPDRIVVGEVRGAEALDMLQAMNTGHDGSLSTGHANSTRDMLSRLETMVLSGADFPLAAVRQQMASALDIMVYLGRLRDKSRRVLDVVEVLDYVDGYIQLNPIYHFVETGEDEHGKIIGELRRTKNPIKNILKFQMAGINFDWLQTTNA